MDEIKIQESSLQKALDKIAEVTNKIDVITEVDLASPSENYLILNYRDEDENVIRARVNDPYNTQAVLFVNGMLKFMVDNYTLKITSKMGRPIIEIGGDDMGIIIGKGGETLKQIQFLTNIVAYKKSGEAGDQPPLVDVEGYRERRIEELRGIALSIAQKVEESGRPYRMRPQNAFERRIIHTELQEHPNVTTESDGVEPERHVIVKPR